MKKNIFILLAVMAAACQKNEFVDTPAADGNGYAIEVTANSTVPSKTTLVDNGDTYSVNWTSNDVISVNGQASSGLTVDAEAANKAVFAFAEEVLAPYCSVYPASAYKAETLSEGTATVVLPAEQTYAEGDFDANAAIMIGYSETAGKLAFEHAVAYMQIKVTTADGAAVKSVSIKGNAEETMSGEFTADFANATLVNDSKDASTVSVVCEAGFESGKEVIIAIPARNYESGVSVTLTDVNGHSKLLKSTVAFNAVAGVVYSTEMELKPKGIWNVEDWTAFAKTVSEGQDYSAYIGEDGEVNLMADLEIESGNFQYVNTTNWNGVFDGNGHTMTSPSRNCPLFAEIGTEGVVKNLNTAGANSKETFANGPWCAASSFAKVNRGTIENCNNSMNTEITYACPDNNGIVIGCFVGSNGGTIKNCKNTGNTVVKVTLATNITTFSAPCIAGGFAGVGHTTKTNPGVSSVGYTVHEGENVFPGRFEKCVNEGDLIVTVLGPAKKTTVSAVGGICGLVVLDGVVFDGCSNSGNISRISDGEGSNDGTSCVGGILGQAVAAYGSSNPHAIDATKGFNTQILNCTNSGIILHNARYSYAIEIASGKDSRANRHATAGGIVGLLNGRSDAMATVSGCTNTGTVTDGWDSQRHIVGGISGYSQYATFTNNVMSGSLTSYKGLSIGVAGGIVGAAYEGVSISGGSSKPSFNCIGKNTVDFCDGLCVGVSLGNVSISDVKVGVGETAKIVDRDVERIITKDNYSVFKELISTTTVGENTTYATTVTNVIWED